MNKLILSAKAEVDGIKYTDHYWHEKEKEFCRQNEGARLEVTMEIVSEVSYYMHKYYRGYLLPDITDASGETSQQRAHYELKKEFLCQECYEIEKIPTRHRTGAQIVIDDNQVVGYIPSMATLTKENAKTFIMECEKRLFIDLGSHIGVSAKTTQLQSYQLEAAEYRSKFIK